MNEETPVANIATTPVVKKPWYKNKYVWGTVLGTLLPAIQAYIMTQCGAQLQTITIAVAPAIALIMTAFFGAAAKEKKSMAAVITAQAVKTAVDVIDATKKKDEPDANKL